MGRHHLRPRWPAQVARAAIAVVVASATWWAVTWWAVTVPVDQAPAASPFTPLEQRYLSELSEAGVQLSPSEAVVAVQIANVHVSHGHLIGMREQIRQDLRTRIAGLSEPEVEIAKVAIEHHFLNVTGRKQ